MKLKEFNITFNDKEVIFIKNNEKTIVFSDKNVKNIKKYLNDKLINEYWFLNENLHNLKSYALFENNQKHYYVNGKFYEEREFKILKFRNNIKKLKK